MNVVHEHRERVREYSELVCNLYRGSRMAAPMLSGGYLFFYAIINFLFTTFGGIFSSFSIYNIGTENS